MSLKRFVKSALVAALTLAVGVLASAARADDDNMAPGSNGKAKNSPPAKQTPVQSQSGKTDQLQAVKGKNDVTPPDSKQSGKAKNDVMPPDSKQTGKGKNSPSQKQTPVQSQTGKQDQSQGGKGKDDMAPTPKQGKGKGDVMPPDGKDKPDVTPKSLKGKGGMKPADGGHDHSAHVHGNKPKDGGMKPTDDSKSPFKEMDRE
jgi:hypothetical protein